MLMRSINLRAWTLLSMDLLQSLDPYSAYMSPKIFEEMQTETSGEFGGLGIEVSMEAGCSKSNFTNR